MMVQLLVLLSVFFCLGCGESCVEGSACDRNCPPNTTAMCGPHDLCLCTAQYQVPIAPVDEQGTPCREPLPGDLVMTELLIDGEPTEAEEMVELVNSSSDSINLDGVAILSERSGRLVRKVIFGPLCMSGSAAVALYSDIERWIWVPALEHPWVADTQRFSFANNRPFRIVLESTHGDVLDQVSGGQSLIEAGHSLTRAVLNPSAPWRLHSEVGQGRRRSPGICPLGGRYVDGCPRPIGPSCAPSEPGDIVINEVMIDAESERTGEYVEILNMSDRPKSLAGLALYSNRGEELVSRVRFHSGCLPPMGVIVMYSRKEDWVWKPRLPNSIRFESSRFGFSNNAAFDFQLVRADGELLDQFAGDRSLIKEGVSINRIPDGKGHQLALHTDLHGLPSSPGYSADGRPYRSEDRKNPQPDSNGDRQK